MTQKEALLAYLLNHKGITIWTAVEQLGITCPHKRIAELEADGHIIDRHKLRGVNRYGNLCQVTMYCLAGDA